MSTHPAVVTASVRGPLEVIQVPTIKPSSGEVLVKVEWTSSTPLDLHQNDGGLLVKHPQVLGDGIAGTVVEVGPNLKNLKLGDKVSSTPRDYQKKFPNRIIGLWIRLARTKRKSPPRTSHRPRIPSRKNPIKRNPPRSSNPPQQLRDSFPRRHHRPWPPPPLAPPIFSTRTRSLPNPNLGRRFLSRSIRTTNSKILRLHQPPRNRIPKTSLPPAILRRAPVLRLSLSFRQQRHSGRSRRECTVYSGLYWE
jgi:hypothetical protein